MFYQTFALDPSILNAHVSSNTQEVKIVLWSNLNGSYLLLHCSDLLIRGVAIIESGKVCGL